MLEARVARVYSLKSGLALPQKAGTPPNMTAGINPIAGPAALVGCLRFTRSWPAVVVATVPSAATSNVNKPVREVRRLETTRDNSLTGD